MTFAKAKAMVEGLKKPVGFVTAVTYTGGFVPCTLLRMEDHIGAMAEGITASMDL
jgi:hypothetical protein